MGIQGLLPFLKAIHTPVNIADFQGCCVAIDAYCWLHKGAFSCAEKLALGEKTDQYVYYCMKYIDYMLRKNIKPILVFDGCHLRSKADVEKARRERRELHRKKAAQFLREGKRNEAKECLQRCVDITPQMALELMNACRDRGVDCIVAPYEADAQLAYLNLKGIAQVIVTEDSDLLLFGCDKIIFKMDFYGNGTLIEKSRLNEVLAIKGGFYTFEKFRYMCILSGCDYLPSIPGIGLARACKVFKNARQPDIRQLLKKLPTYLKSAVTVTDEYIEGFIRANNTFLYQLVFDPLSRSLHPLNPYPPELEGVNLDYAGEYIPEEKAYQIALGNIDIYNHMCIAYFDPDVFVPKSAAKPKFRHHLSIWDKNFRIKTGSPCKDKQLPQDDKEMLSLHDKEQTITVRPLKRSPSKRDRSAPAAPSEVVTDKELVCLYGADRENTSPRVKQVRRNLAESETGFNFSPVKERDLDSKHTVQKSFTTDGLEKINNTSVQEVPGDESSDDDGHVDNESDSSEDDKSRRGQKRKFSSTSSRPSAADIGEDAFKATGCVTRAASIGSSTPDKSRNIFAVSSSAVKPPKFDLDAPAVQVRSRYFHSSNSSVQTRTNKTASSPRRSSSGSSHKSPASQPNKQNSIRVMFENAPVCQKLEAEITQEPKTEIKKGMHRYLLSANSKSESASDTFRNLKRDNSSHEAADEEETTVPCKLSNKTSSEEAQDGPSSFKKFQSNFSQNNKKHSSKSLPCSAFSWSKSKFELKMTTTSIKMEKLMEPEDCGKDNNSCREPKDSDLADLKSSRDISESSPKRHPSLSKFFDNTCHQSQTRKPFPEVKEMSNGVRNDQMKGDQLEDSSDEVIELKSYSYDEFLQKLLLEGKKVDLAGSGEINSISETCSKESSVQTANMGTEECAMEEVSGNSQGGDGFSQAVSGDSGVFTMSDTSLCPGKEGTLRSENSDPNNFSSADSSGCQTRENFIDLTDTEIDNQSSCASDFSKSSGSSFSRLGKCRVPGLSRKKSKSSAKKLSPGLSGQRSIKDLMSKFQCTRNSDLPVRLTS